MTSFPSASDVCLAVTRRLRRTTVGPPGSPLLTVFPELTADAVMGVVGPVLEARDAEIRRLRALAGARKSSSGEGGASVAAIVMQFCYDCRAGNCGVCLERGPELDDGSVCECEHDDLEDGVAG